MRRSRARPLNTYKYVVEISIYAKEKGVEWLIASKRGVNWNLWCVKLSYHLILLDFCFQSIREYTLHRHLNIWRGEHSETRVSEETVNAGYWES